MKTTITVRSDLDQTEYRVTIPAALEIVRIEITLRERGVDVAPESPVGSKLHRAYALVAKEGLSAAARALVTELLRLLG